MTIKTKLIEEKKKQVLDEILPSMIEEKLQQFRSDHFDRGLVNTRLSILLWLKDKFNCWNEDEFNQLLEKECPGSLKLTEVMSWIEHVGYRNWKLTEEMIKFSFLKQYLSSPGGTLLIEEEPSSAASKLKQLFQFEYNPISYVSMIKAIGLGESLSIEDLFECSSLHCPDTIFVKRIGQGKGGTTYKVYSENLQQYRAIKILHYKQLISSEATLMAKLSGQDLENIVQIYDAGKYFVTSGQERGYAIFMEYVDGKTLEEILKERKFSLSEVLDYSAQILNGIKNLRKHGITHRDLKPKNIKINTSGEVKILDFGIATDELHPEARNNQGFGVPKNMEADDLISFGLLVYKMVTGEHLVDVPGKEGMGSDTYADAIDKAKQFLYQDGKLTEEYRKKIEMILVKHPLIKPCWELQQKRQKERQIDTHFLSGGPMFDVPIEILDRRENLASIIFYALDDRDLDKLQNEYPVPYSYKLMDAKELRQLLSSSLPWSNDKNFTC